MTRAKKNSPSKLSDKEPRKTKLKSTLAHPSAPASGKVALAVVSNADELLFAKEYWTGDSRDGVLVNGDGYHYFRMTKSGKILEAYEFYESEDGREFACPLPEMLNVDWITDLGFEDFEALDMIKEYDFTRVKEIARGIRTD